MRIKCCQKQRARWRQEQVAVAQGVIALCCHSGAEHVDGVEGPASDLLLFKPQRGRIRSLCILIAALDPLFDQEFESARIVDLDDHLPRGSREQRPIQREGHFPAQCAGEVVAKVEPELGVHFREITAEMGIGAKHAQQIIEHQCGLFRNERDSRFGIGGNIVKRTHRSRFCQPGGNTDPRASKFQR